MAPQHFTGSGIGNEGRWHITLLGTLFSYITQGDWTGASASTYTLYTYVYNQTNAQNDQNDYWVWLNPGVYTLRVCGTKLGTSAIGTYYLDGTSIGTIDWYSAAADYDYFADITGLTITTKGIHTISQKAATRNALATGWYLRLTAFSLIRTA